jgi:hypothetical protein
LFRLSGELREEGRGEALGQKNAGGTAIEFVADDCVWLDEPPQE